MDFRYTVRRGNQEDCGAILNMLKEQALEEGVAFTELTNTEKGLRDDGFGSDHTFYRSLIIEASEEGGDETSPKVDVVGLAMYHFAYTVWKGRVIFLNDVYIQQAHRGRGLGKVLMCEVAKIAAGMNCIGMQSLVEGTNENARQFYDYLGAADVTATDGMSFVCLRGNSFANLAKYQPRPKSNIHFL